MDKKKTVSIVIPVFNEEAVLDELFLRLGALMNDASKYNFEVVLVENGSRDLSFEKLSEFNKQDPRFKTIQLSRNFMADGGLAAGLQFATGDCAIIMDADLQDPPEIVHQFLDKWEEGYDVVYGVMKSRAGLSFSRQLINKIFYKLINSFSAGMLAKNVTAFRLMDRRVYQVMNDMPERNRFTRGLCAWTGFKQTGIEFDRAERFAGESKAYGMDIVIEALDALFSFSFVPLRIITILGFILSCTCFGFLIFQLFLAAFASTTLPGYRTLIVVTLMMFGFLFIALGILGEYIARIFDEVKGRPIYVVKGKIGL